MLAKVIGRLEAGDVLVVTQAQPRISDDGGANQFARILDQGKCYLLRHFNLAETSQELSGFLSLIGANLYAAPASPNTGPSERCRVVPKYIKEESHDEIQRVM